MVLRFISRGVLILSKLSVLIPVYNVQNYLRECLDSVVNQTLRDIEIICVDDGSKDMSGEILDEYASRDSRVKVIHNKNHGYGYSLNTALSAATSDYIGFIESDDFADKNMFEVLYKNIREYDVDIVKSNHFLYRNGKDTFHEVLSGCPYNKILFPKNEGKGYFTISTPPWNGIYRREFLLKNNIWFNETSGASYQDLSFGIKALVCAERIFLLKDAFLHYRFDNPDSSIHSKDKVFCICDEIKEAQNFIRARFDIKTEIWYQLPAEQYRRYMWSYNRIADEYKDIFLHRMIEEYSELNERNYLRKEYWKNEDDWQKAREMILSPQTVLYRNFIDIQSRKIYKKAIFDAVQKANAIYLYGAGKIGEKVLKALREKGFDIAVFLVSSSEGNPKEKSGVSVSAFDETAIDKNSLILVTVAEKAQYEIIQKLSKAGLNNFIAMSKEYVASLF